MKWETPVYADYDSIVEFHQIGLIPAKVKQAIPDLDGVKLHRGGLAEIPSCDPRIDSI
jgi:hypothetical protein